VIGLATTVRFVHLAAMILLTGAVAFAFLVARPAFRRASGEVSADADRLDRVNLRLALGAVAVAFASALAWLGVQVAIVSGRPLGQALTLDTLGDLVFGTDFGRVWQVRLALAVIVGALLLLRGRERDDRDWLALRLEVVALGAVLLGALAWVGHAAATEERLRLVHLAADVVHLLAAGIWLGGLVPLALLLAWAQRSAHAAACAVAGAAVRRFSALGLTCVVTLVATGVANGWVLVGDVPPLVGTPYGRLLLLKLLLLVPLLGLAAVNRLTLKPRLVAAVADAQGTGMSALLRRLRYHVIAEAVLGGSILLIVGALGTLPPARHLEPSWPFTFRLSWEVMKDVPGVRAALALGGVMVALGMVVILYGILWRRHRWLAVAFGGVAALYFAATSLGYLAVDAYPTTYVRPAVPYHALSVASGARLYTQHCAVCHGVAGYGDGPGARGLLRPPANLTAKHTADHTAGDLFWWLTYGIKGTPMPGFKDHLNEEERWDVINFLRALAAAEQGRRMGPIVDPAPWLVAPDFAFGTGVGPAETLKAHRGWAMVHLVLFTLPASLPRLEELDRAWGTIGLAGARIIAVPMADPDHVYRRLGLRALNFPIAAEGAEEIADTYALFRRTPVAGVPRVPLHLEFLIDRQGYVRARWIPGAGAGWKDISRLLAEIARLDKEAPRAPAPEEHVH
jgi:putative copper resistance protein D